MELGVSPIVSAGMVLQLLVGSRMMHFNQNAAQDRVLFQAAEKICGILFTFVCATAYVVSGMYGPLSAIGNGNAALIVLQLTGAGVVLLMLDEYVQKYGFGSGLNLFIAVHICETIVWSALSTVTVTTAAGTEMEGEYMLLRNRSDMSRREGQVSTGKDDDYAGDLLTDCQHIFCFSHYIHPQELSSPCSISCSRAKIRLRL